MKKKYNIKKSFLIGILILTIAGLLSKILGAIYKIPLTNILGTNGIGIYYLIFPIYSALLVISSSGISTTTSRLISIEQKKIKSNEFKILLYCCLISLFISVFFSIIILLFAKQLAFLQGYANAYMGYYAIIPAIIFASILSVFRGYFQGKQDMMPTSISQIIEQLIKVVFGLIFSKLFLKYGIEFAVFGAILGVSLSEIIAFLYIIFVFIIHKSKTIKQANQKFIEKQVELNNINDDKIANTNFCDKKMCIVNNISIFKQIFIYSIPITFSALIFPINSFLDSFIIINLLMKCGFSNLYATSLYGISNGIVNTLISLPLVVINAISISIIPNLSGEWAENKREKVLSKIHFFIKISWVLSIFMFIIYALFCDNIIYSLYGSSFDVYGLNEYAFSCKLLFLSSISIIYYSFLQTFIAILQAINKPNKPLIALTFSSIIRCILLIILVSITNINIFGQVIANIVFLILSCIICLNEIKKNINLKFNFRTFVISPLIAGIVSFAVMLFIKLGLQLPDFLTMIVAVMVGISIYLAIIITQKTFNYDELKKLMVFKRSN